MMTVMPSNRSCIATCLLQKLEGNVITDPHRKKTSPVEIAASVGHSKHWSKNLPPRW
jgi:hypothetical protein